jgi:hypothetical protein
MSAPELALIAVASLFALMGLGALFRPDMVVRQFGGPPLSPAGRNEVRAVYGGFGVAMAGLLLWTFHAPALREGVTLTLAFALFGMAAGRFVSALIDRRLDRAPLFYFVLEIAAGAALLFSA